MKPLRILIAFLFLLMAITVVISLREADARQAELLAQHPPRSFSEGTPLCDPFWAPLWILGIAVVIGYVPIPKRWERLPDPR